MQLEPEPGISSDLPPLFSALTLFHLPPTRLFIIELPAFHNAPSVHLVSPLRC